MISREGIEVLVKNFQNGDDTAFKKLIIECENYIYSIIRNFFNGYDADDVYQDICLKLYHKIKTNYTSDNFKGWLSFLVNHHCIDVKRGLKKEGVKISDLEDGTNIFNVLIVEENKLDTDLERTMKTILYEAIDRLPNRLFHAFYLFYIKKYPVKEIATTLNTNNNTVLARLHYSRNRIKKYLHTSYGIQSLKDLY